MVVFVYLLLTAILGDYLVLRQSNAAAKALFDNATHAIIGSLCWTLFYINSNKIGVSAKYIIFEIAICALIASMIDLDHFIAAKSFSLKDATRLKNRPFLHCTTLPLVVFMILAVISYSLQWNSLKRFALLLLTAFISHHIRDATRRGLWLYPFGSTAPIPYAFYITLTCLVPFVFLSLERLMVIQNNDNHNNLLEVL
ncbi:hypothetical protein GWI33_003675 [Rhynchophorus ferrugineus]|uniref:Transmembrane protein 267 n=1 Tax=Rhynchophorus ferrugineus TaxID=354439 RepID=A0A834MKT9_RHYFE|nr:hypothetical protein GWI33_003675 [Rhynchophorus ferrugineus]